MQQVLASAYAARRRKDRDIFLKRCAAFGVIVVYGVLMAGVDVYDYEHKTMGLWFEAAFFGALAYVLVWALLTGDEDEAGDDERLQRLDGVDGGAGE